MKKILSASSGLVGLDGAPLVARQFMTHDNMFGRIMNYDAMGNHLGHHLPSGGRFRTNDGKWVTVDSTGAFLIGELERLDLTLNEPLVDVTWSRDIQLREDVTIADEISAFTLSTYASAGNLGTGNSIGNGKAWVGKSTTQIGGVDVDIAKVTNPLRVWALELRYTILELESSARVGRSIDTQKYEAIQEKHQMDTDEQVYVGDTTTGDKGLLNNASVARTLLPNGATGGSPAWSTKTADEILADVNSALTGVWTSASWAVLPSRILLPPTQFGLIATAKVSSAGNMSILEYVLQNNIVKASGRGQIEILPAKWCVGAGNGGTIGTADGHDRMCVYSNNKKYVRFPMTLLQRTPVQYAGLYQNTVYFGRLGRVEFVYPDTAGYYDGL